MLQRSKFPLALVVFSSLFLGACWEDYLAERDTVSTVAGDAVAFNKATQTIEHWPAAARQDRWKSNGDRAKTAIERYKTGTVIPPQTLVTGDKAAAPAPAAPPPPTAAAPAATTGVR